MVCKQKFLLSFWYSPQHEHEVVGKSSEKANTLCSALKVLFKNEFHIGHCHMTSKFEFDTRATQNQIKFILTSGGGELSFS